MSSISYEIRPFTESFRDQILELQGHHWGANEERNAAYLRWKYYENPYMDEPCITLALERDRVVGMRGMYGACWSRGKARERFVGPCAGDVVIHPDHRGRGLFDRMMAGAEAELVRRGYRYAFNLSSGATTYVSCLKLGWKGIGSLRCMARSPAGRGRLPRFWRSRHGEPVAAAPQPVAMAALVDRTTHDDRIRHVRDAAYFAWRFRNPFSRYRFVFEPAAASDEHCGFLVLQYPVDDVSTCRIVDWQATDDALGERLLERAIAHNPKARLEIWAGCASAAVQHRLHERGFCDARDKGFLGRARPTVLVRHLPAAHRDPGQPPAATLPLDRERWDVRMVFSDAF